ncbi:hypothetical protein ACFOLC_08965 [Lysobacter cavernae]|uniref:Uncharacterized protein n=1 Tax=Lysobacter cavernae TaxID=1685901 RepID=A0ABV7RT60_9GAMM
MLDETQGYAVFFFPQALEVLGEAIKPYLHDGPTGPHMLCQSIDTGGALLEMTIEGRTPDGQSVAMELMVPTSMVRMIVSARSGGVFGFGPRIPHEAAAGLPPVALAAAPKPVTPIELPAPSIEPAPGVVMAQTPPKR